MAFSAWFKLILLIRFTMAWLIRTTVEKCLGLQIYHICICVKWSVVGFRFNPHKLILLDEAGRCAGAGGCSFDGPTEFIGITNVPGVDLTVAQREHWGPDGISFPTHCPRLTYLWLCMHLLPVCVSWWLASAILQREKKMPVITTSCPSLILTIFFDLMYNGEWMWVLFGHV